MSAPVPEGTPCDDNAGVCRDGFCAQTEADGLFAWSVGNADDFFVVGSKGVRLVGGGSVRVFRRFGDEWRADPLSIGYLTPRDPMDPTLPDPNGHPLNLFGASLALTPSGDTLVVGAPGYSTIVTPLTDRDYSGAAYVFAHASGLWTQEARLTASNVGGSYECSGTSGEGDGFGATVAVSGDTVVVGAPAEASAATGVNGDESDDSAPGAGAVYVFERVDESWEQTAYLKASNTNGGDRFGFAVAIDGDTIAIGAQREDSGDSINEGDNNATDAGAVYIFERTAGTWEQTQFLKASNVAAGYFFGANLSISDTTLVVGSPGESSIGGEDSGAAYIFTQVDGSWVQTNFYKAFNADAGSSFAGPHGSVSFGSLDFLHNCATQATTTGASLSLSGDTLAVGTPYEDSAAVGVNGVPTSNAIPNSGAVYIFDSGEEE